MMERDLADIAREWEEGGGQYITGAQRSKCGHLAYWCIPVGYPWPVDEAEVSGVLCEGCWAKLLTTDPFAGDEKGT